MQRPLARATSTSVPDGQLHVPSFGMKKATLKSGLIYTEQMIIHCSHCYS
ncbi:hypothetical protein HMPREF9069_01064 [Atopobium sp. oral taxon 810 str. F0209]|nr:hypothetical protein HMPREF9069_01064 [Atopobium sp. oral taxon 810 str. F0209]